MSVEDYKFHITQFSSTFYYFLFLGPNILNTPYSITQYAEPSFGVKTTFPTHKNKKKITLLYILACPGTHTHTHFYNKGRRKKKLY
jgi:hypothetical protein